MFDEPTDYELAEDAINKSILHVDELGAGGSVPKLHVTNHGPTRVLFLEGLELVGAKQNRIVNASLLIAADSKGEIPVSCVEQGRWHYRGKRSFGTGARATAKLRGKLKKSVTDAIRQKRGHESDQAEIWREVADLQRSQRVRSSTSSMSDAFTNRKEKMESFAKNLLYVPDACGLAISNGGEVISIDVFDKPSTCAAVWDRLVQSAIFNLDKNAAPDPNAEQNVRHLLAAATDAAWLETPGVGEGHEYRCEFESSYVASALCVDASVIHASVANADLASKPG